MASSPKRVVNIVLRPRFQAFAGEVNLAVPAQHRLSLAGSVRAEHAASESLVTAALPLGDDAELLAMPRNRPVLRVKTVNRITVDGSPGEYALSRFRADRVQLQFAF